MRVNDAADRDRDSDSDTEDHDKEELGTSALLLKVDKIVLENEEERYMLVVSSNDDDDDSLGPKEKETETNKENVEGSLTLRVERRYDVYSLKPLFVDAADATPSTPSPDATPKSTSTPTPRKEGKVGLKATEATSESEAKTKTNGTSHSHVDNGGDSHALPSPTSANTSPRQERAVGVGKRTSLAALMDDLDDDVKDTVNAKELKDSDVHQHQHSSGMPTPPLTTAEVGGPSESSPVAASPRPHSTTRSNSNSNSKSGVQYEKKELELELEPPVLAELVHRGLGAERLRFVASGVSIVASSFSSSSPECNNGAGSGSGSEKPTFVRVDRWRRAAPREVEALSASAST